MLVYSQTGLDIFQRTRASVVEISPDDAQIFLSISGAHNDPADPAGWPGNPSHHRWGESDAQDIMGFYLVKRKVE